MVRITTYPIQHVLELGPDAARIIEEARLDPSVCHLVLLEEMDLNYVKVSCRDNSAIFVIQDEALCELIKDGGPRAYIEQA